MSGNTKIFIVRLLLTLLAIVLALVVGMAVIALAGLDLQEGLRSGANYIGFKIDDGTVTFRDFGGFAEVLGKTVPLIFTALAFAIAMRCGMVNIGGEGQFIMGAYGASLVAIYLGNTGAPEAVVLTLMFLVGVLFGGLWAVLAAVMKITRGVNEIISTIMLNYIATFFVAFSVSIGQYLQDPSTQSRPGSAVFSEKAGIQMEFIEPNSDFTFTFFFAILALFLYYVLIYRSKRGYELRVTGYNKTAAEYSGMNVKGNMVLSMFLAGGMAGAGAAFYMMVVPSYLSVDGLEGYGFTGIVVALIGGLSAVGIFFAALFFGLLDVVGSGFESAGIPMAVVQIIQALSIVFVLSTEFIMEKIEKRQKLKKEVTFGNEEATVDEKANEDENKEENNG